MTAAVVEGYDSVLMALRTVLCYGDSNTWGRDPHSLARLPLVRAMLG